MDSHKSTPRAPRAPQRQHGKKRVAELLEAGKAVFAEKGYAAATMAEIAARAQAPIGSLYRFFPSKEAIAEALIGDSIAVIDEAFHALQERVPGLSTDALADALLDLMVALRGRTRSTLALMEGYARWSERHGDLRAHVRGHIATTLRRQQPGLAADQAEDIAFVVQQAMKLMASFVTSPELGAGAGACEELRLMTRLYLANRLGGG